MPTAPGSPDFRGRFSFRPIFSFEINNLYRRGAQSGTDAINRVSTNHPKIVETVHAPSNTKKSTFSPQSEHAPPLQCTKKSRSLSAAEMRDFSVKCSALRLRLVGERSRTTATREQKKSAILLTDFSFINSILYPLFENGAHRITEAAVAAVVAHVA